MVIFSPTFRDTTFSRGFLLVITDCGTGQFLVEGEQADVGIEVRRSCVALLALGLLLWLRVCWGAVVFFSPRCWWWCRREEGRPRAALFVRYHR